jgi:hypothetical protein
LSVTPSESATSAPVAASAGRRPSGGPQWFWLLLAPTLAALHTAAIWLSFGGWSGLTSPWPIPRHDHPVHFHSLSIAPRLFALTGTNAGYDPSFMAGYAKSVVFPQSSALFDVVALASGGRAPAQTYKLTVFAAASSLPWLVLIAASLWSFAPITRAIAVLLFVIYVWTDGGGAGFPLNYAGFGMTTYLLAVPLGLVALALYTRFLDRPSPMRWILCALVASLLWLVHITTPMIAVPAALAAYFASLRANLARSARRHLGTWALIPAILILNAFWWWPGLQLAATMGDSTVAFSHSDEPLWERLLKLLWYEPPIQIVVLILLWPGLVVIWRENRTAAAALAGYILAGLAWGYVAGVFRALDFLQPGRHAYAWHVAGAIASAAAFSGLARLVRPHSALIRWGTTLGITLLAARLFGYALHETVLNRVGRPHRPPFLASDPPDRLRWILKQIETHMRPGERLFYEESGNDVEGVPDPYQEGRFSGLLPYLAGVEVIGGPYLRAALTTNFTQFGENRLFGRDEWDVSFFTRHAKLYQPSAIICWTPRSIAFCQSHPELFDIRAIDERALPLVDPRTNQVVGYRSRLLFATLKGFGRSTIKGNARVAASPGRLVISDVEPDELDGRVILRYHHVPRLQSRPEVAIEAVRLEDDPVPFIAVRPPPNSTVLELSFRP